MAEGTGGMIEVDAQTPHDLRPIEAEIQRRREELTTLGAELNRRSHELMDARPQIRRHALSITATVLAVGAVAAGSIALRRWRARHRDILIGRTALIARPGRLREAFARMVDRPERVALEPTAIGSAGSAVAVFLIKAAMERVSRPRPKDVAWTRQASWGLVRDPPELTCTVSATR